MVKNIFQDKEVEHCFNCSSTTCMLEGEKPHFTTHYFETSSKRFIARSLREAAKMWINDGIKELLNVGSLG